MNERERRAEYLREMLANPRDPRHGKKKGYSYGCRCGRCRAAMSAYELERKAKEQRELAQPQAFVYAFPEHRHAAEIKGKTDLLCQALRIRDEVDELIDAIVKDEGCDRIIEESLDIYHADETFMRHWSDEKVFERRNAVVAKNKSRGYYLRKGTR